jgi:hypothetical protein
VAVLSKPPRDTTLDEVTRVTAEISGAWLMGVAEIGTLGTRRTFGPPERAAFLARGFAIQSADALCDFDKDAADGLTSSLPAWLASCREPGRAPDRASLRRLGIDRALLGIPMGPDVLDGWADLGLLLRWIRMHLASRYAAADHACEEAPCSAR